MWMALLCCGKDPHLDFLGGGIELLTKLKAEFKDIVWETFI